MSDDSSNATAINVDVRWKAWGNPVRTAVTLPAGPMRSVDLLPVIYGIADTVAKIGVMEAESQGRSLSCHKGCGICCRHIVAITTVEAQRLAEVVARMPEPRQSEIRRRFAAIIERLNEVGLFEKIIHADSLPAEERRQLPYDYFDMAMPCPFLEDEACSIYEERPTLCRTYMVSSPSADCAFPGKVPVEKIEVPAHVGSATAGFEPGREHAHDQRVPLTFALLFAEKHPAAPASLEGGPLLQKFFQTWAGFTAARGDREAEADADTAPPKSDLSS